MTETIDADRIRYLRPGSTIILIFIIIATGGIIYSNTLHVPFILDDNKFIVNDYAIQINFLNFKSLTKAAFEGLPKNRPISNITFALNYYFGRLNPPGYHLVNITIHILTGIFLFFFVMNSIEISLLTNNPFPSRARKDSFFNAPKVIAFFTSIIWIAHPTATESVTYVCQRMTSLAAMFFVLSLLLYVLGRITFKKHSDGKTIPALPYFIGCIISGIFAVASKENAATLPLFILLYEWFFFLDLKIFQKKTQVIAAGIALLLFAIIAMHHLGINPIQRILASYKTRDFNLNQRVLTEFRVILYYISLFFWPSLSRLNLDHDYPLSFSFMDPLTTGFSFIAIAGMFWLSVYSAKKDRLVSFCILWFLGNLAIESSVIGIEIIFEHRMYLPVMMVSLLLVSMVFRNTRSKRFAIAILSIITLLFSVWTYQRNMIWQDTVSLYRDCASKSPGDDRAHQNLGVALFQKNDISGSISCFKEAIRCNPSSALSYINLGNALRENGEIEAALDQYKKALHVGQYQDDALMELGNTLLSKKHDVTGALHYLNAALKLNSKNFDVQYALASALAKAGNMDQAITHYNAALAIHPESSEAHNDLANIFAQKNMPAEAIRHYHLALKLNPKNLNAHINLAHVYARSGRFEKAEEHYRAALATAPLNAALHKNIGNTLYKQGRMEEAANHFGKYLQISPDDIQTRYLLGVLLDQLHQPSEAIRQFKKIAEMRPENPVAFYNVACLYAKQNLKKEAVFWLEQAVEKGYSSWEKLKTDPDMKNLRNTKYYKSLINK